MEPINNVVIEFYKYLLASKCKDVALYDLRKEQQGCDFIFVVTNSSQILNKKFATAMLTEMNSNVFPEGYSKGEWIIFDFNDIVLHSFIPSKREKYSLDKLWKNKRVDLSKLLKNKD